MKTKPAYRIAAAALAVAGTYSLAQEAALPGLPLSGISARELELFREGREDFMEVESASEGLGPMFNGASCAQCPNVPALGGTGAGVDVRAGRRDEDGRCDR